MFWALVWIVASMVGCAVAVAVEQWVTRHRPDWFIARTGLDPRTREVVGPPALGRGRAQQLLEVRRRAGVDPWRTRG